MSDLLVSFRRRNLSAKDGLFSGGLHTQAGSLCYVNLPECEVMFPKHLPEGPRTRFPVNTVSKDRKQPLNFAPFGHSEQRAMMVIPVGKA